MYKYIYLCTYVALNHSEWENNSQIQILGDNSPYEFNYQIEFPITRENRIFNKSTIILDMKSNLIGNEVIYLNNF